MGCCTACAVRVTQGSVWQPEALGISQKLKDQASADGRRRARRAGRRKHAKAAARRRTTPATRAETPHVLA